MLRNVLLYTTNILRAYVSLLQQDHKTVIPSAIAKTSAGLAAKHSSTLVRTGSWSVPRTTKNSNETIEMERQLEFEKLRTKEMKQEVLNLQGRVQRQEGLLAAAEDAAKERRANEQRNKEMLKILSSNITFVDGKNLGEGSFGGEPLIFIANFNYYNYLFIYF